MHPNVNWPHETQVIGQTHNLDLLRLEFVKEEN